MLKKGYPEFTRKVDMGKGEEFVATNPRPEILPSKSLDWSLYLRLTW